MRKLISSTSKSKILLIASFAFALFFAACQVLSSDSNNSVLDIQIDKNNDSLLTFDTLIIKVYSKDSSFAQEVFHGKLTDPKKLLGIQLDPRVGKEFKVSIQGYKGGKLGVNTQITVLGQDKTENKSLPIPVIPKDTIKIDPAIPIIVCPSDTSIFEGESLRIQVTISKPWTGITKLLLSNGPTGSTLDSNGYLTWKPTLVQGRTAPYPLLITYSSADRKIEKTISITVKSVNQAPKISPIPDQKGKVDSVLSFKVEVSDSDQDSITISIANLPTGSQFISGTFTWSPLSNQVGNYPIRIRAFDGNDSDLIVVLVTIGDVAPPPALTLKITSPSKDTIVNSSSITIVYMVNGTELKRTIALKPGRTKVFVDTTVLGTNALDTVGVTLDTVPPTKPTLSGLTPTNTRTPTWSWVSGGGGNGKYRMQLDAENLALAPVTSDLTFTSPKDLDPGSHTLFIQERDDAGNWSLISRYSIRIDTTRPPPPTVSINTGSPTNDTLPIWSWSGTGADINGQFRFKLDNSNFSNGATETKAITYPIAKGTSLKEGLHTLYVEQQDSAGNWSDPGSIQLRVDLTAPAKPSVTTTQTTPTNVIKPTWTWSTGGQNGMGVYRFKLDDSILNSGATAGAFLFFSPDSVLKSGTHTFYVQERDSAGNWSPTASKQIRIDLTPPNSPKVLATSLHTINPSPTWHWSSGGNGGIGNFRYKLDDSSMAIGTTLITDTTLTPTPGLALGTTHTLYVQEVDSAGNWSGLGSYSVRVHGPTGYAFTSSDIVLGKTINSGATWDTASMNGGPLLFALSFVNASLGYGVGYYGTVVKTTNGGAYWQSTTSGIDETLYSVYFTTANVGYAVGESGKIYKTSNGASSWAPVTGTHYGTFFSISFVDPNTGFMVGGEKLLKTNNAGAKWDSLTIPYQFTAVAFTTINNGFATGSAGKIFKTVNGGTTWRSIATGIASDLDQVTFTDENTGYVLGGNGSMAKTTNAGESWAVQGANNPIVSVYFTDAYVGYAFDNAGNFLKTMNGGIYWEIIGKKPFAASGKLYFP
jgi:photosystem II stability/assembly factor-like uncharacterized protein